MRAVPFGAKTIVDAPGLDPLSPELARAARILAVRSRRNATGFFTGSYTSAFRGGGMEFHESRPYVAGDDVRFIDWSAMARTGEPYVKHYREERNRVLLIALDVSASMAVEARGPAKTATALYTTALLAAAGSQAGDRVGFVAFAESVRTVLEARRGAAHSWNVIRSAALAAATAAGKTRLAGGIEALLAGTRQRGIAFLISDFRENSAPRETRLGARQAALQSVTLAHRHDLVSIVLYDPVEEGLPRVGRLRLSDPEHPGRCLLLDTDSARVRARYRRAWEERRDRLERDLRRAGSDVVWLRTDHDPLKTLMRFFHQRHRAGARARVR